MSEPKSHIEELKELSHYLTNLESELSIFWQNTPALLSLVRDGKFVKVNPAWTKCLGYTKEELIGKSYLDFVHPDDIAKTEACATALSNHQVISNFTNRYRHKAGYWVTLSWFAYEEENTKTNYATAIVVGAESDVVNINIEIK